MFLTCLGWFSCGLDQLPEVIPGVPKKAIPKIDIFYEIGPSQNDLEILELDNITQNC